MSCKCELYWTKRLKKILSADIYISQVFFAFNRKLTMLASKDFTAALIHLFSLSKSRFSGKFDERNALVCWLIITHVKTGPAHTHLLISPKLKDEVDNYVVYVNTGNFVLQVGNG